MKECVIIDCYETKISPHRDIAFQKAFEIFKDLNWYYIRYDALENPVIYQQVLQSNHLILSGSELNVPDESTQLAMKFVIQLVMEFRKPILGICFGHQLLGHIFGFEVKQMEDPKCEWGVEKKLLCNPPFPLLNNQEIEVELHHVYEIRYVPELEKNFILHASSDTCKVVMISHRERPIFGVQFHPETNKSQKCIDHGQELLQKFIELQ